MRSALCAIAVGLGLVACKAPGAKIEGLRAALASNDEGAIKTATEGMPVCADTAPEIVVGKGPTPREKGCLSDIANAFGSNHGFKTAPIDQASAATAALVVARDHHGEIINAPDAWLATLKNGSGTGIDALRLAVARAMASAAPLIGKSIDEDKDALAAMKAIAGAIPGSCPAYAILGGGADPKSLPAELSADHSACVQRDLGRREGPGGRYGEGVFRALEGSLSLWREAERALRLGLDKAAPPTKTAVEKQLETIEPATRKTTTKKVDTQTTKATVNFLGDIHAEAGVTLWKDKDAGADAEAGAPTRDH